MTQVTFHIEGKDRRVKSPDTEWEILQGAKGTKLNSLPPPFASPSFLERTGGGRGIALHWGGGIKGRRGKGWIQD